MKICFVVVRGDGYEGQCKVQDAMHAVDGKATQSTAKR